VIYLYGLGKPFISAGAHAAGHGVQHAAKEERARVASRDRREGAKGADPTLTASPPPAIVSNS